MSKVDEFGRLVREDHSDSDIDSGDSPRFSRMRSKRGRSRSWSRSPIKGRSHSRSRSPRDRRRSPWRRRGRHSRSRSFSPKRRRSRSRSPSYRPGRGVDIGNDKMRRHKAQLPECRDHIRGKCNRGASCRYMHHKSDTTSDRLGSSHMNQRSHDVLPISNSSIVSADTDPITPKRSVHEHKENYESQNLKQEVLSTEKTREGFEERYDGPRNLPYTETPVGAPVHLDTDTKVSPPDISSWQTQVLDGQAAAENSLQTPTPLQSQSHLPSSGPYLNKDSSSTSYGYLMSTEHQRPSESTMPQSHLPELSHSVGNHSSNLSVGNSTTFSNHIPRDYNNSILQCSKFPPSTTSWTSLPPPPPLPFPFPNNSVGNTARGLPSAQFQQNSLPPCNDLRYPASSGQRGVYPQMPGPQKSLYDANRFGPRIMPVVSNPMDQIHGMSSHSHPYMNHSPYSLHSVPDGVPAHYGEPGKAIATLSNYSSASQFPPLASTLNKPVTAKFSSNIVTQGNDVHSCDLYGTPYSLNHASADGLTTEAILPTPAADQYDPLSDSIEPSSSSGKKPDISQKLPTCDSDGVLRTSGSNQLLDVDENNKLKGSEGAEGSLILENDLNDETADAEVGAVEDGSGSNPQTADMSTEDDEINQVKASEKTKKGKDSKFMKLFKIAIADFVKEVLKPSWRQGNMSKEAFKTIVKKTVDKVSGTTRKRHIPKSREKIDQFIDSQQRKLIKLVTGYVDKYVKA